MCEFHFQDKLIKLVEMSILKTFVKVKIKNISTDPIVYKSDVEPGNTISQIVFNTILDKIIKEMNKIPQE